MLEQNCSTVYPRKCRKILYSLLEQWAQLFYIQDSAEQFYVQCLSRAVVYPGQCRKFFVQCWSRAVLYPGQCRKTLYSLLEHNCSISRTAQNNSMFSASAELFYVQYLSRTVLCLWLQDRADFIQTKKVQSISMPRTEQIIPKYHVRIHKRCCWDNVCLNTSNTMFVKILNSADNRLLNFFFCSILQNVHSCLH